ncbi:MAG: dimethyl sulfoxide reductase anchor subunit family protein, partial [Planctomycetaceae bacterium]
ELTLKLAIGNEIDAAARPLHAGSALVFGLLALGASVLHLGRPHLAFRAVIGLRHSWLSREILAFGLFAPLAAAYAVISHSRCLTGAGPAAGLPPAISTLTALLGAAVVLTGLAGVGCSVMVYAVTRRDFWSAPATAVRFLLTTLLLGTAAAMVTATFGARWESPATERLAPWMIALAACKLAFESLVVRHLRDRQHTALKRTALLMTGELSRVTFARFGLGLIGGALLPVLLLTADAAEFSFQAAVVVAAFAAVFAGELLERYLFFTAVVRRKMPGSLMG